MPDKPVENTPAFNKKVCLLGDFGVGKTSLVRRFVYERFEDKYLSTIGVKVSRKAMSLSHKDKLIDLSIILWDLAGSEEFNQFRASYLRGASGIMLVCDLTRPETLHNLPSYLDDMHKVCPVADIILAANKADLKDEQRLSTSEIEAFISRLNIPYYLTSAKSGDNVETIFRQLGQLMMTRQPVGPTMENSLDQLILQSRKIAYALTDRELVIQSVHGHQAIIDSVMNNCLGCSLIDVFPELLGNQQDLEDILAGKLSNLQLVYINRETQSKTIYLTMDDLPYKDETGRILGIVHVVQDETSRGELEQQITQNRNELKLLKAKVDNQNLELVAANNELVRQNEFKAQFVHVATYELRNPLKTLIAYLKMLLNGELGFLSDAQSGTLKIVQQNGLRLKSMVDELISAVRLEAGQIDLELKPVDLVSLVNAVATENAAQIQSKKQVLDLEFSPDLPLALCDEDWTKQIVTNLMNNANKFTPESGHISIRVRLADQTGFLLLSVADTGVGISEQERSEILSGMFQSKGSSSQSPQSPGMGLYITRSMVELNRGSIWFESQPNLGSVFHVTLPIAY